MFNQPEFKRGRNELGSSDIEEPPTDIRELLKSMQHQLQKLDLLQQLTSDVGELKLSVEYNNSLIEVLKADNASLRSDVNKLKRLTEELQQDNTTMANTILDLQCRSMRDNFIVHGLPETPHETYQKSEDLIKVFMSTNLKMHPDEIEAIHFSRVHRLGRPRDDQHRPRPIVAKTTDSKMKYVIMSKGGELRKSKFAISDQFPAEILRRRRLLYPVMAQARKNNKKTRLFIDKLYINGSLFRDRRITDWLSGGDETSPDNNQPATSILTSPEVNNGASG